MAFVYCFTNRTNGKSYVGQTWDLSHRQAYHKWAGKQNSLSYKSYFHKAIHKYGWKEFDLQILGVCYTQEELNNLENLWIVLLNTRNSEHGYNLKEGGSNGRPSEFSRDKMRLAKLGKSSQNKGKSKSAETRKKLSQALKVWAVTNGCGIIKHGTTTQYRRGCRCKLCKEASGKAWQSYKASKIR